MWSFWSLNISNLCWNTFIVIHVLRIVSACVCVWFSVLASIHEGGLSYIYLSLVIPYVFNTLIKSRDYTLHIEGWGSYMVAIGYLPGHDDWEIFTLKIICVKNFRVVKFSRFGLICEIFLTVEDRWVPWEFLEHLVFYQIMESQVSLAVVVDLTFTLGVCSCVHTY